MRRLRPVRRKMSWTAFERLPPRLGWKHEYYGGIARPRPSRVCVVLALDLAPRAVRRRRGLRPVTPADAPALRESFLDAFALSPEYAGWPMIRFREAADEYLGRYFGTARGEPSPVSVLAEAGGAVIGAAL